MSGLKPMTRERALVIFDELVAACETGAMDGMFPPGGIPDARKFFADHSARVADLEHRLANCDADLFAMQQAKENAERMAAELDRLARSIEPAEDEKLPF